MKTKTFYLSPKGCDKGDGSARSPFASLSQAFKAARDVDSATVILKSGEYKLSKPLALGAKDTRISVKAAPGATVVISALRDVTSWRVEPDGLWSAPIPWVTSREKGFRQFFVNGEARARVVYPKNGGLLEAPKSEERPEGVNWEVWTHNTLRSRFEINNGDIDSSWDIANGEVVFYHFWVDSHVIPKGVSIEGDKSFLELEIPLKRVPFGYPYRLFNVIETLSEPGEWAIDYKKKRLYYKPMKGESIDKFKASVPSIDNLLTVDGASDVSFSDIIFRGCRYELPYGQRNDGQASNQVPSAVIIRNASRCSFDGCRFEALGGYAVDLLKGTHDCSITHCTFTDLAAGGIRINSGIVAWHRGQPEDVIEDVKIFNPRLLCSNNVISDCEICNYGLDFPSACGILIMHAEKTQVVHNHIHDGYYTGVSCGWIWGHMPSVSRDNEISFNHIHDIGKGLLSDMGAVYTLGVSPGTRVSNNLIHGIDARHYGGWGLYTDEGSSNILLENNVVYDTKFSCYHMHFGRECVVRNNIFGGGRIDQLARTRRQEHISFYFYNNIVYWTQGKFQTGNWNDETDYDFCFFPGVTRKMRKSFVSDWNIYFNPNLKKDELRFDKDISWDEWVKRGQDMNSVWADPKFKNPGKFDFTLSEKSPAYKLGFKPIDMSTVGPRKR